MSAGNRVAEVAHAAPLVVGLELAVVEEPRQDAAGKADVVEAPLIEGEELGHLLLDDRDLDPRQRRQLPALHRLDRRLQGRVVAPRKRDGPVVRIGVEHDARSADPLGQAERPRAHGLAHDVGARRFDRFARDGDT